MNKKYLIYNTEFDSEVVMEMFEEVFDYMGNFILNSSDEDLAGIVYEDYDFCYMNLADFRLDILLDSKLITNDIAEKAKEMRSLTEKMLSKNVERSGNIIRNSSDWQLIISLAEEIRIFLNK